MEKKKIGIILRNLSRAGVTRFISNILFTLDNDRDIHKRFDFHVIYNDDNSKLIDGTPLEKFGRNLKKIKILGKNILLWDYIFSFFGLKDKNFDVLLYPKNNIPLTHNLLRCKKINVIHDLLDFSSIGKNRQLNSVYNRLFFRISCNLSDRIIAVSKSTKKEIIRHLNIDKKKICVVYEAADKQFKEMPPDMDVLKKYNIKKPFIFYVGSDVPRKNIKRLVESFKSISHDVPHHLVLAGNFRKKYKGRRINQIGYISNHDLVSLYNLADLYAYPSLYEGFGLPILEAQACGCPVLASNTASCPEIAGDGACIINPYSEKNISEGIVKVLTDDDYKNQLIEKGYGNLERFSWEKTVSNILEAIKDV
ncbi:glycosyltransferase [Candidatus Woesearchaeota archaeon]|nr:glycosyltransferase [Candidatus Woesearchaeota archaeon]